MCCLQAPPASGSAGPPAAGQGRSPSSSRVSTTRSSSRSISAARSGTARMRAQRLHLPLHRPGLERRRGRRGADRRRSLNQGRRGDRDLAVERAAMANLLKERAPTDPDHDHRRRPRARPTPRLRKTYLGTDNYLMGVKMAEHLKKLKPDGGTVCLQLGNVAADNINARAAGTRDTLAGEKGVERLDRPGRLDRDRRLPGLHQRPGRSRQPADGRYLHRQSRPRRLRADRRLGAVRAAGLCPGHRPGHGQAEERRRW